MDNELLDLTSSMMDHYYNLKVYKSDIEVYLEYDLLDEEFDKIMESFEIFQFDGVMNSYILTNKLRLVHLLRDNPDQMKFDV
jgi:hypothetical protein